MPNIVKNLLLSKKFVVAFLTGTGAIAMYFGWSVNPSNILIVISPFLAYIGAQGWADSGKEQALVTQGTTLRAQQMAQDHDVKMAALRPSFLGLNSVAASPIDAKDAPPGFALLEVMLVVATVGLVALCALAGLRFLVPAGVAVAAIALAFRSRRGNRRVMVGIVACLASCAHPGQSVLRAGQCILDNGVLGDVLGALAQADYVRAIEGLGLRDAAELVDCALQAVAIPQPGAGPSSAAAAARTAPSTDTLAQRAREVLASRRAAGR